MDKEFELKPHNNQKSYYGKARVVQEGEISTLISYTTKVAQYDSYLNKMEVYGWFSSTTSKHINSFLSYFGFKTCCKKELENYGNK